MELLVESGTEENRQGWNTSPDKFFMRINDMENGKCIPLTALYKNSPAGYINVYPDSEWGSFGGKGYPEIVDFAVLEKFRRMGIGSLLMDIAESIADITVSNSL